MTTDLESRVRAAADKLDAAAERYVPPSRLPVAHGVSRRTALIGSGTLVVAAIAGGIAVLKARSQINEQRPTGPEPSAPQVPTTTKEDTTTEPVAANTSSTLGSAESGWSDIAQAPLTGREDAGAVWTGVEFLVWGGRVGNFLYQQGAAYNPVTNTWREITANQWAGLGTATTWTGTQMVALFKNGGVVYDPAKDTWSDLGAADTDQLFEDASWTGTQVLGIGGRATGTAAFVATATITPGDQSFHPGSVSSIPWTSGLQFAPTPTGYAVWRPTPDATSAEAWAYDVERDVWTELPELTIGADNRIESSLIVSTTTGWIVVLTTKSVATRLRTTLTAKIEASSWRTTELPITVEATQGIGIDNDRIIAFGSQNGTPVTIEINADGTLGDTWTLDPQATTGQALAWNGATLFAWGGRVDQNNVSDIGRLWTP